MKTTKKTTRTKDHRFLDGQLLIAMPTMSDKRFARSVIYMCAHSNDGAMGLIINQRKRDLSFSGLLEQLDIINTKKFQAMPSELLDMNVHIGGPVATRQGFVLHSADYFANDATLPIDSNICLTATLDILKAIAAGKGPDRLMLALGYASWRAGQLESEIQANGWLNCPADLDIIFDPKLEFKYDRAMSKLGIDPSHFVSEAGHA
jgi:putative transcriptional regulator